jgi:hypothetical protein
MPLLSTLPGDIEGLLRRGSPFTCDRLSERGEVREVLPTGAAIVADRERIAVYMLSDLSLDLTDPTGRAHAAWWAYGRTYPHGLDAITAHDTVAKLMALAMRGADMTSEQINTLARLVLRLAGRTA